MKGSSTRPDAERPYTQCALAALCAALLALPLAAGAANFATVTVKVTVVAPPPCIINGNRVIEVNFGDVIAPRVDGSQYLQTVDYSLECEGRTSNAMKLAIQGNPTSFDNTALQTNVADLGIALRANGKPLAINSWVNFTYPSKPVLQAVPVKRAGVSLPGGNFSAGATLQVLYQ
ncbi:fimbrial protein [Serratia marcescens]|uniref:fimbrial protein n=1 Tax=Serratia marcescens TaxID=615 RepID=UPI0034D5E88C